MGLGQACAVAQRDLAIENLRLLSLREHLWSRLQEGIPGLALNGHPELRLPNTLNVRFPGVSGNRLLEKCTSVAASTGSACHESGESASAVILAMGIETGEATGSVRLSLGRFNTKDEADTAAAALIEAWRSLV